MDLRSLGGFWLNRLPGDGSCVKLAQRKDPPYGEKKAAVAQIRLQIDTSPARSLEASGQVRNPPSIA